MDDNIDAIKAMISQGSELAVKKWLNQNKNAMAMVNYFVGFLFFAF